MMYGVVIDDDGLYYSYESATGTLTGCSSQLSGFTLSKPSHTPPERMYSTWAGVRPLDEVMRTQIKDLAKTDLRHRLVGVWGRLAEAAWNKYSDLLPSHSVCMRVDGKVNAVFWSRSMSVVGEGGYTVPEFMIDPQKSLDLSKFYQQGVFVTEELQSPKRLAISKLEPLYLEANANETCWSGDGQDNPCEKVHFYVGTHPQLNKFSRLELAKFTWNPEYKEIRRPWWETWRELGFRVPPAKEMLDRAFEHLNVSSVELLTIGGNFGTKTGNESCRVVAYLQRLAINSGTVMSSVLHEDVGMYTAVCPIVYRSDLHENSFVACSFISAKPIEWEWKS